MKEISLNIQIRALLMRLKKRPKQTMDEERYNNILDLFVRDSRTLYIIEPAFYTSVSHEDWEYWYEVFNRMSSLFARELKANGVFEGIGVIRPKVRMRKKPPTTKLF